MGQLAFPKDLMEILKRHHLPTGHKVKGHRAKECQPSPLVRQNREGQGIDFCSNTVCGERLWGVVWVVGATIQLLMLSVLQIETPLLPVMCLGCHSRVTYSHRQNKTGIIYPFPFFLFHIIVKPHRFSLVWLHQPSLPPTLSHPLMLETPRVLSSLAAATSTHPTFNPRFGPLRKWSLRHPCLWLLPLSALLPHQCPEFFLTRE